MPGRLTRRWLIGLGAVYLGGVAAGALAAPLLRPTVAPPTSVSAASPAPVAADESPAATPSPVAQTPQVTAAPPIPSATASPSPTPTAPPPSPTTVPATSTPTAAAADPADLPGFVADLGAALRRGRDQFLLDHLHPVVLDRYGEASCRRFTATAGVNGLNLEYLGSNGPEPWDWELDGLTTRIDDGWTVVTVWRQPGLEEQRELHLAPSDGTWRWFTDCGDPL